MKTTVIAFLLGIISLHRFQNLPSISFYAGLSCSLFAIAFVFNFVFKTKGKVQSPLKIWRFVFAFLLGLGWSCVHAHHLQSQWLPKSLEKKQIWVVGTVSSLPEGEGVDRNFEFEIEKELFEICKKPGKIKLFWSNAPPDLSVGQRWQLPVKLKRPHGFSNPGGFDEERHFFQNRWVARGSVCIFGKSFKKPIGDISNSTENNVNLDDPCAIKRLKSPWYSKPVDRIRQSLKNNIEKFLKEKEEKNILLALLIGTREHITPYQWEVFRNTGTAHLMAISGLHIALMYGFAYWATKKVIGFLSRQIIIPIVFIQKSFLPTKPVFTPERLLLHSHIISIFLALFTAFSYALLSGFSVPTQRALVMLCTFASGTLLRRIISRWDCFFLSLGLVLVWDPLSTLSMGFWLSFSAVFILLLITQNRLNPPSTIWTTFSIQWAFFIGLFPLSLLLFDQISIVSSPANIISIPWMSFTVVPLAFIGAALYCFNLFALAGFSFNLACHAMGILWPILEWFSKWPKASVMVSHYPFWTLLCAGAGALWLLLPKGIPGRGLAIIWILPIFLLKLPGVQSNEFKFTVLDVGQGLASVVQTKTHTLVYDTGGRMGRADCGERVVAPFLRSQGIDQIDTIIISHADMDHIGGLQSVLQKFQVKSILTSDVVKVQEEVENAEEKRKLIGENLNDQQYSSTHQDSINKKSLNNNIHVSTCYAGQQWIWDGVLFEMLHPNQANSKKRNDLSCVLKVSLLVAATSNSPIKRNHSLLLTGDIEDQSEQELINRYGPKLQSTVLVIPHHGSRTSSSIPFIEAVNPTLGIVTTGYLNRYGHPKWNVMKRYQSLGIPVLDTLSSGAITGLLTAGIVTSNPNSEIAVHLQDKLMVDTQKVADNLNEKTSDYLNPKLPDLQDQKLTDLQDQNITDKQQQSILNNNLNKQNISRNQKNSSPITDIFESKHKIQWKIEEFRKKYRHYWNQN